MLEQIACETTQLGSLCAFWESGSSQGGTLSEAQALIDALKSGSQSDCGSSGALTIDFSEEPCCVSDYMDNTCICGASGPTIKGRSTLSIDEPACVSKCICSVYV